MDEMNKMDKMENESIIKYLYLSATGLRNSYSYINMMMSATHQSRWTISFMKSKGSLFIYAAVKNMSPCFKRRRFSIQKISDFVSRRLPSHCSCQSGHETNSCKMGF